MKKSKHFHPTAVCKAVGIFATLMAAASVHAGPGFGDAYDLNKIPFAIQSYFASSPAGARQWVQAVDTTTNPPTPLVDANNQPVMAPAGYALANQKAYDAAVKALYPNGYPGTGAALRKFVDVLPLPAGHPLAAKQSTYSAALGASTLAADPSAAKYIPVAVPQKWVNPAGQLTNDDYYEIAVVEYSEKMHSDLKKATTLRGYVQVDHLATNSAGASTLPNSKGLLLYYPNSSGKVAFAPTDVVPADAVPVMVGLTDANGKLTGLKGQARVFDAPHYLGPILQASRNVPTRIKFHNLLPVGRALTQAAGHLEYDKATATWKTISTTSVQGVVTNLTDVVSGKRNGDLFLPVDPSIAGAGVGPNGTTEYTQNRVNIHLHGGDNPWISDGTPHQWITPAGERDVAIPGSMANTLGGAAADPVMLDEFTRGVGAKNVPDMNDPGVGAMTYYFPNGQSARMEWYHDHTYGITRLNVYSGIASSYLLTDAVEQNMISTGALPAASETIPLILQDKTFVPDDILLQDSRWSVNAWGAPGDLWFPHVYETVQDPNQDTRFNAVGRWHWGPWFWPSFPSAYLLPTGVYGDVTTTPEAWNDTPVINGVAYPTLTVDPKPYRLRILNAANDRSFTFNLFVAPSTLASGVANTANLTEVSMVPVLSRPTCADPAATRSDASGCFPANWAQDVYGHAGGLPDPSTQGPTLHQIASEGGWLPGVASKDPAPVSYLLDKGRAAVLNVEFGPSGLHIGNGERADVVVDFSQYCGQTLIVYNDSGAPVPAADPRNEYFTGYGDNSSTGGAEDTLAGYGPNTRTMMQFKVSACAAGTAAPLNVAALDTAVKAAYASSQETPVVAQSAYNAALGTTWNDTQAFADIFVGSLKEPAFKYVPGDLTAAAFNSIVVSAAGSGYVTPPSVTLSAPQNAGGVQATATASLKIDQLHVINGGSGYKIAPLVTITSLGKGSGAGASTRLAVGNVQVVSGGSGYGTGSVQTVAIGNGGSYTNGVSTIAVANAAANRYPGTQVPAVTITGVGTGATAVANMVGNNAQRRVGSITITNPGINYATAPTVTIAAPTGTGTKVQANVGAVTVATIAPAVTFSAPPAGGIQATGTAVLTNGVVTGVNLTNAGSSYATAPTVTFSGGTVVTAASATTTVSASPTVTFALPAGRTGAGLPGTRATGTAVVNAAGVVTAVNITNPGSGYTTAPSVTISGGTGASAVSYGTVSELVLDVPDPLNPGTAGGGGYDNLVTAATAAGGTLPAGLTITLTAPPAAPAAAGFTATTATAGATGKVFDITLNNQGSGYTASPTLTVGAPVANTILAAAATMPPASYTAATATTDTAAGTPQGSRLVKTKAIQELFDPTYGRLNATFGVEIPFTSALTQTTIPLGYVDQTTEEFQNGETQIWKITHNGVDTHPIHFHLLNVQLINRVGWDNFITPPEPNELGWKETIKMSPLEDVIVAVRAKKPQLRQSTGVDAQGNSVFRTGAGFGLPNSVRRQDPSQAEGVVSGFTQIDPNTGMPAPMANTVTDYGWEYVWHCHILGHEENDFMRPVKFNANEGVPLAATGLALDLATGVLSWADNADTEFTYTVDTATTATGTFVASSSQVLPANSTTATVTAPPVGITYRYRVTATGQAGSATSQVLTVANIGLPAAPTVLTTGTVTSNSVALSWTDNATNEASYNVVNAVTGAVVATVAGTPTTGTLSATVSGLTASTSYSFYVEAVNAAGKSAASNTVSATTTAVALLAPGAVRALNNGSNAAGTNGANAGNNTAVSTTNLSWTAPRVVAGTGAATSYRIESCSYLRVNAGTPACTNFALVGTTSALTYGVTMNGSNANTRYVFRVTALNGTVVSTQSNTITINP